MRNETPEGNGGAEEPLVEALAGQGGQVEELGERQQLEENAKQFARAAGGRSGIFLKRKSLYLCMFYNIHTFTDETKKTSIAKCRFLFEKGDIPLAGPERLARTGS